MLPTTYIWSPYNTLIASVRPHKTPPSKSGKASKAEDVGKPFLDGCDIIRALQQTWRKRMAEGMSPLVRGHSRFAGVLLESCVLGTPNIRFSRSHSYNFSMAGRGSQAGKEKSDERDKR